MAPRIPISGSPGARAPRTPVNINVGQPGVRRHERGPGPLAVLPEWWAVLGAGSGVAPKEPFRFPLSGAVAPDQLIPVPFGQVRVGGTVLDVYSPLSNDLVSSGFVIVWSEGPIASIDAFLCEGVTLAAFSDANSSLGIAHYLGNGSAPGGAPYPTPTDVSFTDLQLYRSSVLGAQPWFLLPNGKQNGRYEWAVDMHGLCLYDPRQDSTNGGSGSQRAATPSTWTYSNNPALVYRYIKSRYEKAAIDDVSIAVAADAADTAGFTCNIVFTTRTPSRDAIAAVLQTCNGIEITANGKCGLFLDLPNAGAAVATLSEEDGDIWGLKYEYLSARDRYTRVAVSFKNAAANYKDDQTPDFDDPGIALLTVPIKALVVAAPGINTLDAAVILRDYLFNSQAVRFRLSGMMSGRGITLQQGQKVRIKTLKGTDLDFILIQLPGDSEGFFSFASKPYDAAVWGTTPVTQGPPIFGPPPPFTPPTAVTFPHITTDPFCYWSPPRALDAGTAPTLSWAYPPAGPPLFTPEPVYGYLDLGAGVAKKMGRYISRSSTGSGTIYAPTAIEWSDDGSSWTGVSGLVLQSWIKMSSPTTQSYVVSEWTTPTAAHRYWRANFGDFSAILTGPPVSPPAVTGDSFYDVLAEIDPFVTAYEVHNSSANMLLSSPELDPIFTVIPASSCPTATKPLDLRTIVFAIGVDGIQTARVCIVPVGNRGPGAEPVLLIEDAAAVGFYPGAQNSAAVTVRQAGVAMDVDSVALDVLDLATATPGLSAAGHARLKTDGAAILASINGGAYAALGGGGSGTVTSVGLAAPSDLLDVSGSPVTAAGTLTLAKPTTTPQGKFYGGPASGGPGAAAFRFIDPDDLSGVEMVLIVETPAGVIDGVNDEFVLSKAPESKVLLIVDSQEVQGGVTWGQYGTGNKTIRFAFGSNLPQSTIKATYMARVAATTAPPDTLPTGTAETWTAETPAATKDWIDVAYSPTLQRLAAICTGTGGDTQCIMVSDDGGETWALKTTGSYLNWRSISWCGDRWVVMPDTVSGADYLYSTDGETWVHGTKSGGTVFWNSYRVVWFPPANLYVAIKALGGASTARIATSPDLETWTDRSTPNGLELFGLVYAAEIGMLVAVGKGTTGSVIRSPDAINWEDVTPNTYTWKDVAWASDLRRLVAVSDDGITTQAMISDDGGATWALQTTPTNTHDWTRIVWSRKRRLLVAVSGFTGAEDLSCMTSPEGETWAEQITPPNTGSASGGRWTGLAVADDLDAIVAVGQVITGSPPLVMRSAA
ncbi:MAG: hypothetical protein PHS14_14460 [Elusimicrobia bacterium]|nr:hypothetical protein [Elusimicrobiota bacterium]